MRGRGKVCLVLAALGLLPALRAEAVIPRSINLQGRLADSSGTPLSGQFPMKFVIWEAPSSGVICGGNSETATSTLVSANSGLFSVAIDMTVADTIGNCHFDRPYWLEIKVARTDASGAILNWESMSPRIALTAAPYAFNSERLNGHWLGNPNPGGAVPGEPYVPVANNAVQAGLNADRLDNQDSSVFATVASLNYPATPFTQPWLHGNAVQVGCEIRHKPASGWTWACPAGKWVRNIYWSSSGTLSDLECCWIEPRICAPSVGPTGGCW